MAMFGQLSPSMTVTQLQQQVSALLSALQALENSYQWLSAYALADLEGPPMNFPAGDGLEILNALADAHNLYQTALGVTGFPTAQLPYNFLASLRAINGAR